jgi:putative ABC transport system permease protein
VRRVVIVSDRLWKRHFNSDPNVLARSVDLNGVTFRVIGVMPAGFEDLVASRLYNDAEAWTPLGYDPAAAFACRTCRHLRVFGRLASGRSPADADRDLTQVIATAALAHPTEYDHPAIRVVPLGETFFGPIRRTLIVLAVAVGLLLLVACGNVSNLLLLRATERAHEVAVRTALGVTAPRLARQFLTESVLLALVGGVAGLPVAWAIARFFVRLAPPELPRLANVTLDGRALGAALLLIVGSGILFGLAPLAQILRQPWTSGIHGAGRRTSSAAAWRLRGALVAGNVAMAAMLLIGSGLLARSLAGLMAIDVGFNPDRVLTLRVSVGGARFSTPSNASNISATTTFYDDVLTRVRALPGVEAAAGITTLPLSGDIDGYGLHVIGRPLANPESAPGADRFVVTPDFFRAAGVPLAAGRLLDATDRQGAPAAVVVNATLAREIFPGEDAIGHQLALGGPDGPPRTIVGVVGDIRHRSLDAPAGYQVYVPQAQWSWAETDLTLLVRGRRDPSSLAAPVREIIREVDPAQAVDRVRLYDDVLAEVTATRRVAAQIIGLFAVTAVILAIIGLSGALGVVARQRRQEIGVRMALGAGAGLITRLIMTQGLRPAILGLLAGLAGAALSVGALRTLLYGVRALDPITFAGVSVLLLAAAVFACVIPAWRASRTSPVVALRE